MKLALWKQAAKRNILFWGRHAELLIFFLAVYILIFSTFFFITDGESGSSSFYYVLMLSIMAGAIGPMSYGNAYLPLVISMGSKRKEAVWGLQFMNLLLLVQMEIIALLAIVLDKKFSGDIWIALGSCFFCMMLAAGAGQMGLAAKFKWGTKGMVFYCFVLFLGMAFAGVSAGFLLAAGYYGITGNTGFPLLLGGICLAGMIFYTAGVLVLLRTMKNYVVRV